MSERKLASIQRVRRVEHHPNADALDLITVNSWQLCTKRDEFAVGDLCVYMEIDSILPPRPEFDFLRPRNYRVKTIKLRGCISQGIAFPMTILPLQDMTMQPDGCVGVNFSLEEGSDVTAVLGVTKYEPKTSVSMGAAKGMFPSFLRKTDEERVQGLTSILASLKGIETFITEKLDGMSFTCYLHDDVFGVCSRNIELAESAENVHWKIARSLNLETILRAHYANTGIELALQGEIIGEGIQSNRLKMKGQHLRAYNVFSISSNRYFDYIDYMEFLTANSLISVPVITTMTTIESDPQFYVDMANGMKSVLNPEVMAEGVVVRTMREMYHHGLGRVSFKAINNEYLLKHGE